MWSQDAATLVYTKQCNKIIQFQQSYQLYGYNQDCRTEQNVAPNQEVFTSGVTGCPDSLTSGLPQAAHVSIPAQSSTPGREMAALGTLVMGKVALASGRGHEAASSTRTY